MEILINETLLSLVTKVGGEWRRVAEWVVITGVECDLPCDVTNPGLRIMNGFS